jgi:type IV pilus assembly protein PilV
MRRAAFVCRIGGFTLVEVLVAVFVLALGLIGGVGMQLHALRTRYEAAQLSRAVQLAAEMAERIRANPLHADAYVGFEYDAAATSPEAVARTCEAAPCSPAELAGAELQALKRALAQQFPTGRVRICRDTKMWNGGRLRWACSGGAGAPVVIKIGWRGKNPDGTVRTFGSPEWSPGIAIAIAAGGVP